MTTQTTGTVVDGQLQLDAPLDFPNQSRVQVTVQASQIPPDWRERYAKGLAEMRELIKVQPIGSGGQKYTREQLHERD